MSRFQNRPRVTLLAATAAGVFGLGPAALSPGGSRADEKHTHCAMFEAAKGKPAVSPIYDPRLSIPFVQYTPVRNRVIVEGDIDLGSIAEVKRFFIDHVGRLAGRALDDPKVVGKLTEAERERLRKAKEAARRPDQADPKEAEDVAALLRDLKEREDLPEFQQHAAMLIAGDRNQYRWPDGLIAYLVDPGFRDSDRIRNAVAQWHGKTDRIRLVRLDKPDPDRFPNWVRFVEGPACSSRVGKAPDPGEQLIVLGSGCGVPQVIHEIGHAVGLFHEQSRNDRDQFIQIDFGHVEPHLRFNFDPMGPLGGDIGPFDFQSIMLYPPRAFSMDGSITIRRRNAGGDEEFGIASGDLGGVTTTLSAGDIKGVAAMYPKPAKSTK